MNYDKAFIRKKFILRRKKRFFFKKKFPYPLIFNLIKKRFKKKNIIIGAYYPSNFEVNILNFLREVSKTKIKIALPIIKPRNKMQFSLWEYGQPLYVNSFGILEPQKGKNIIPDIFLVPLVAFDKKLNRIGYGKGYYDRALNKIIKRKKSILVIGIAYSFQETRLVPTNRYDFKLNYIFTDRGIISSK